MDPELVFKFVTDYKEASEGFKEVKQGLQEIKPATDQASKSGESYKNVLSGLGKIAGVAGAAILALNQGVLRSQRKLHNRTISTLFQINPDYICSILMCTFYHQL